MVFEILTIQKRFFSTIWNKKIQALKLWEEKLKLAIIADFKMLYLKFKNAHTHNFIK